MPRLAMHQRLVSISSSLGEQMEFISASLGGTESSLSKADALSPLHASAPAASVSRCQGNCFIVKGHSVIYSSPSEAAI